MLQYHSNITPENCYDFLQWLMFHRSSTTQNLIIQGVHERVHPKTHPCKKQNGYLGVTVLGKLGPYPFLLGTDRYP